MDEKLYCDACMGVVSNSVTLHDQFINDAGGVSSLESKNQTEKK